MKNITEQEFETLIELLRKNMEYYVNCLEPNRYFLGLANGENINLTFPRSKVPHLLGIQIDKIIGTGIVKRDITAYELLQKLLDSDITYYKLKNANFSIDNLFSEYIKEKLLIFSDILKIRTDDLECIIKYYPDRTYMNGVATHNSDYFIIRKHEQDTYSALGIKKENENSNKYIPVTSRYFASKEELNEFLGILRNQEVTYPHTFSVENYFKDYSNKIHSKYEEKLKWCRTSKLLSDKFGLIPVNNSDTINTLERVLNFAHEKENRKSIIYSIADSVKDGYMIDKKDMLERIDTYLPDELDNLIDILNDHMYSNSSTEVKPEQSYSELTNRLAELERKNKELQNEIEDKNDKLNSAYSDIENLNRQLDAQEEYINIYEEAHNKVLSLRNSKENKGMSR